MGNCFETVEHNRFVNINLSTRIASRGTRLLILQKDVITMQKFCKRSGSAKPFISLFSALMSLLLIFISVVSVCAESYLTMNGFSFLCNSSDEAIIYSYDERNTDVEIPKTFLGSKVVEIANYAFMGNASMTSISFDKSVYLRKIGISAFANCTGLKNISIAESIESISQSAFQGCSNLERVEFSCKNLSVIPSYAFANCQSLKRVNLPDGLTKIEAYAFSNCGQLSTVFIPDSVTYIDPKAFDNSLDIIIVASKNSYAEDFAIEHSLPFISIDEFILGDVNCDTRVDITDVTEIQKYLAKLINLFEPALYNADTDANYIINILDATEIQKFLAKLPSSFDNILN